MRAGWKALFFAICITLTLGAQAPDANRFRAGASVVDITPVDFPVIVNGGFLEKIADKALDRLYARALVMTKGAVRVAIVVVDSCMVPRDLLDQAKEIARSRTGIPVERMLISATHTHSAPAAMGCLGTDADVGYAKLLPARIANAIESAAKKLTPARVGWTVVDDREHTHCRRWIFRPDKMLHDPFGARTVRANMHPGYQNPDALAPSGPVDPAISLLSIQSIDRKPLAVLANYSMHYFGSPAVSSDYYGPFSAALSRRITGNGEDQAFVAMMSQGTSGDQMWMDYGKPKSGITLQTYAESVADIAWKAYQTIQYRSEPTLAMEEARISLRRRVPDPARLSWARDLVAKMGTAKPRSQPEVYAREQVFLHEDPVRELKLQALRVGDLGITAIPNEVFAITGLKLKALSPLKPTFNIELANGAEGYIPPPEQHSLGGYTTWPARTAALEVEAEPKIVESLLQLLEKVAGRPRRAHTESNGTYVRSVLASRPEAYWRLSEFSSGTALDLTGRHPGLYRGPVAFYVPGPQSAVFSNVETNRAVHLAGGWFAASIPELGSTYSVEMWFWNGLPNDARTTIGHLFSRGGDTLAISGRSATPGRLVFSGIQGETEITPKTWHYVALIREDRNVRVYLNGKLEIRGEASQQADNDLLIGGVKDGVDTFEGKIDEIAVYDRPLSFDELVRRHKLSGM